MPLHRLLRLDPAAGDGSKRIADDQHDHKLPDRPRTPAIRCPCPSRRLQQPTQICTARRHLATPPTAVATPCDATSSSPLHEHLSHAGHAGELPPSSEILSKAVSMADNCKW
ncbi:hypothetical protein ACLOJK_037332 [Asimina triloba]